MSNNLFEARGNDKHKNNNSNFKKRKENTISSLHNVEYFLNDFKRFANYIRLYRILK